MATNATQEAWFRSAVGRAMNPDGAYGLQCVDVADDYCQAIFGSWQGTIGGGNANQLFRNSAKLWAINYTGSNRPERGDIIIWGGDGMNPYGHIAVVASSTNSMVSVVQQNYNTGGAANKPASLDNMPYSAAGMGRCVGWLRPKVDGATTPDPGEVLTGDGGGGGGGGDYGPPPRQRNERDAKGGGGGAHSGAVLDGMDWDKLCMLESSGRWDCNTGNGFYGGIQFTESTWREFGGGKYAAYAHQATREQQIEIGRKVLAVQGVKAWPNTGPKCYNPGAKDSEGSGGGDTGPGADFYKGPSLGSGVTKHVPGGTRVAFDSYVLGERVEYDGGGSSFWYKNADGYTPYRYWEPTETSGLEDTTAYDTWGNAIGTGEHIKSDYKETFDGARPWVDGVSWDYGSTGSGSSAGSVDGSAVYCPPGMQATGGSVNLGGYEYDIPSGPVTWGDIPESLWNYLMSIGWRGIPGDGAERLYPPGSIGSTGTFTTDPTGPVWRRDIGDAKFDELISKGWRGLAGDASDDVIYPPNYLGGPLPHNPHTNTSYYPVTWGECSEALWNYLMSLGWAGRPGDGAERLYPPMWDDSQW